MRSFFLRAFAALILVSSLAFAAEVPQPKVIDATVDAVAEVTSPSTAAKPVVVQIVQSPAPAAPTAWYLQLTQNPLVITSFLTACVYVLKWLQDQKKLEAERWHGVIVHCFALAEEIGVPGAQKLANAMQEFETIFSRVFGVAPSRQDRADAVVDLAKMAASQPVVDGAVKA